MGWKSLLPKPFKALAGASKKPKVGDLGEENKFYYNEKLKKWVEKGKEEEAAATSAESAPPPINFSASPVIQRRAVSQRYVLQSNLSVSHSDLTSLQSTQPLTSVSTPDLKGMQAISDGALPHTASAPKFFIPPTTQQGSDSSKVKFFIPPAQTADTPSTRYSNQFDEDTTRNSSSGSEDQNSTDTHAPAAHVSDADVTPTSQHIPTPNQQLSPSKAAPPTTNGYATAYDTPTSHDYQPQTTGSMSVMSSVPPSPLPADSPIHPPSNPKPTYKAFGNIAKSLTNKISTRGATVIGALNSLVGSATNDPHAEWLHPSKPGCLDGPLPWELPEDIRMSDEWYTYCKDWQRRNPDMPWQEASQQLLNADPSTTEADSVTSDTMVDMHASDSESSASEEAHTSSSSIHAHQYAIPAAHTFPPPTNTSSYPHLSTHYEPPTTSHIAAPTLPSLPAAHTIPSVSQHAPHTSAVYAEIAPPPCSLPPHTPPAVDVDVNASDSVAVHAVSAIAGDRATNGHTHAYSYDQHSMSEAFQAPSADDWPLADETHAHILAQHAPISATAHAQSTLSSTHDMHTDTHSDVHEHVPSHTHAGAHDHVHALQAFYQPGVEAIDAPIAAAPVDNGLVPHCFSAPENGTHSAYEPLQLASSGTADTTFTGAMQVPANSSAAGSADSTAHDAAAQPEHAAQHGLPTHLHGDADAHVQHIGENMTEDAHLLPEHVATFDTSAVASVDPFCIHGVASHSAHQHDMHADISSEHQALNYPSSSTTITADATMQALDASAATHEHAFYADATIPAQASTHEHAYSADATMQTQAATHEHVYSADAYAQQYQGYNQTHAADGAMATYTDEYLQGMIAYHRDMLLNMLWQYHQSFPEAYSTNVPVLMAPLASVTGTTAYSTQQQPQHDAVTEHSMDAAMHSTSSEDHADAAAAAAAAIAAAAVAAVAEAHAPNAATAMDTAVAAVTDDSTTSAADLHVAMNSEDATGLLEASSAVPSTTVMHDVHSSSTVHDEQFSALHAELTAKQAACDALESELTAAREHATTLASKLTQLHDVNVALVSELADSRTQGEMLQQDVVGAQSHVESLQSDLTTARALVDELQSGLTAARASVVSLQRDVNAAHAERDVVANELKRYQMECGILQEELRGARVDYEALEADFNDLLTCLGEETAKAELLAEKLQELGVDPEPILASLVDGVSEDAGDDDDGGGGDGLRCTEGEGGWSGDEDMGISDML